MKNVMTGVEAEKFIKGEFTADQNALAAERKEFVKVASCMVMSGLMVAAGGVHDATAEVAVDAALALWKELQKAEKEGRL